MELKEIIKYLEGVFSGYFQIDPNFLINSLKEIDNNYNKNIFEKNELITKLLKDTEEKSNQIKSILEFKDSILESQNKMVASIDEIKSQINKPTINNNENEKSIIDLTENKKISNETKGYFGTIISSVFSPKKPEQPVINKSVEIITKQSNSTKLINQTPTPTPPPVNSKNENEILLENNNKQIVTTTTKKTNNKTKPETLKPRFSDFKFNFFSKSEMYYEPLKTFLNEKVCQYNNKLNNNLKIELNLEMDNQILKTLKSSEILTTKNVTLFAIYCTGARVDYASYKDQLEQLIPETNVILTFLLCGSNSKPIVKVEEFDGNVISIQVFKNKILESDVNNDAFNSIYEIFNKLNKNNL